MIHASSCMHALELLLCTSYFGAIVDLFVYFLNNINVAHATSAHAKNCRRGGMVNNSLFNCPDAPLMPAGAKFQSSSIQQFQAAQFLNSGSIADISLIP